LIDNWKRRQTKSKLQEATQEAFGQIHVIEQMVALLQMLFHHCHKISLNQL
jgi:hypothetical protein